MLQLKNNSGFAAQIAAFPDEEGIESLVVVVKASFSLTDTQSLLETQIPVHLSDEYWGEPGASSLKEAGEMHLHKAMTDFIVTGHAGMEDGQETDTCLFSASLGDCGFQAVVCGERRFVGRGGLITSPSPFERMALVWEHAFGGGTPGDERVKPDVDERNPVGGGHLGRRKEQEIEGALAPSVQDPACLVRKVGDKGKAVGGSFVAPQWKLRRQYAGTYDAGWQRTRAPYLPKDYDQRFQQTAPEGMRLKEAPMAGQALQIQGLYGLPAILATIPKRSARIAVKIRGHEQVPETRLETVRVDGDRCALALTWRAIVACDRTLHDVESVTIEEDVA